MIVAEFFSQHTQEKITLHLDGSLRRRRRGSRECVIVPGIFDLESATEHARRRGAHPVGRQGDIRGRHFPRDPATVETDDVRFNPAGLLVEIARLSPAANRVFTPEELDRRIEYFAERLRRGEPCDEVPHAVWMSAN